jgi:hypothetical protein
MAGRTESTGQGPGGGAFVTNFVGASLPAGSALIVSFFA